MFAGQLTLTPVLGSEGGCEFVILSLTDISYRKLGQVVAFQEAERRLLSAELHDVVSQPVVGLHYLLQTVEKLLVNSPERAPERAAEARAAATPGCWAGSRTTARGSRSRSTGPWTATSGSAACGSGQSCWVG